jgi:hypothetical protein
MLTAQEIEEWDLIGDLTADEKEQIRKASSEAIRIAAEAFKNAAEMGDKPCQPKNSPKKSAS